MTQHMDEGRLQAHLDGELSPGDQEVVRDHLRACPQCRESLRELEVLADRTARAIARLDPPTPDVDVALWDVRRRRARRRSGGRRRGLTAAAAVILLVAAGAAAAVPGSPLRSWIDARLTPADPPVPTVAAPDETVEVADDSALGVTVDLRDGSVRVSFRGVREGMILELEPTREDRVGVFGPAESQFRTASGRVDVDVRGPGQVLRVQIPEGAHVAEVWAEDVMVARIEEGRVALPGRAAERALDGRIRIELPRLAPSPETSP